MTSTSSASPEYGSLRSDDDHWDIVSGVGYTALLVAGWRALHAVSPEPLVRDDYAKLFITASQDPYLAGVLANPGTSVDETAFPRLYGVQTRFFDDFFNSAVAGGIRQAVIVAAGLDSRAYRLDWPDGTTVFEVDLPKVLEFKGRVLREQGATPKARRREVAADLRTDWPTPLKAAGFDTQVPSAWSVEGILPYLTDDAQTTLFTRISELCAPGSRVAVGALGTRLDHSHLSALETTHPGVNKSGNVDFSKLTYETNGDPAEWLAAHGWGVEPVRNTLDLQAGYRMSPPDVDVKIDAFMHSQYITAVRS
jgi:methyltransferase (TIGR00027 family)